MKLLPLPLPLLLLLCLGLTLFCAHGEGSKVVTREFNMEKLSGKWYSILLASNTKEKIEENGSLRFFVEEIRLLKNSSLSFKCHKHVKGNCIEVTFVADKTFNNFYAVRYDGINVFEVVETDYDTYVIFYIRNLKRFQILHLLELYGREPDVSPEVKNRFREITKENHISEKNIVDLTGADRCLKAREEK